MTDIQSMGDISKIYDEIDEVLKFITTSGVRIKMMASILQSPKSSTQLKDELGVGASTVIHAARDLEKEGILTEKPDGYHLTGMGIIAAFKIIDMVRTLNTIRFPDIIEKVAERGVTMEFLVTPNVFNTLKKEKYRERLKKLLERDNFSLYLSDGEIKLAFTVTDFVLSFALYLHDGLFDNATDLISYNAEAINWGRDLFEYYKSRAKRISTEDI